MNTFIRIALFIILTTLNFEFLINRQSSTLLLVLAIAIEIGIFYLLILSLLKKIIK